MHGPFSLPKCLVTWAALLGLFLLARVPETRADTSPSARLRPSGLEGAVLLVGAAVPVEGTAARFAELARKDGADLLVLALGDASPDPVLAALKEQARGARSRTLASAKAATPEVLDDLKKASGIWIVGTGTPAKLLREFRDTALARELRGLRLRGRVIAGSGSAAALLGQRCLDAAGKPVEGFGLLPGTLVDTRSGKETTEGLRSALGKNSPHLGVRVPSGTALLVHGRRMQSLGEQTVLLCLGASATHEARTVELKGRGYTDYNEMRRAALARSQAPYPPKEVPVPEVPKGSLVIVGGGGMPAAVARKFVELGGGADGHFVVLPISMPDPLPASSGANFLKKYGARNVVVLPGREREVVEDPRNLEVLKKATAIWFGGGRQWRFVDAYEGTKAHDLFRDVLRRGGVIGGSSAGATIQGDYLVRGAPAGPHIMMCEGYERALGFLPGVAIDQHFAQRKRFKDMTALMQKYPQFLGIGLDEATALVVQGHVARIMGRGKAHFYDRRKPVGEPDHDSFEDGTRYDLKERKALPPAAEPGKAR